MPSEVALVCFLGEFYRNLNRFLLPDYEIDQIKEAYARCIYIG